MKRKLLLVLLSFSGIRFYAQPKIIFDIDFGGEADDPGALAMIDHFQNKVASELLAVVCRNTKKYAIIRI